MILKIWYIIYQTGVDKVIKNLVRGGVKIIMITGDSGNFERKIIHLHFFNRFIYLCSIYISI